MEGAAFGLFFVGGVGYIAARAAPLAAVGPDAVTAAFGSISPQGIRLAFDLVAASTTFEACWQARNEAVVLTYAEFGRRPKENVSGGTDHGTANVHFALGGRVAGGMYGAAPDLGRLSGDGNPAYALDFRSAYATVLDQWWGVDSQAALAGRFAPVPFLKT